MDIALKVIGFLLALTGALLFAVVGVPVDNPVPLSIGYTAVLVVGLALHGLGRTLDGRD